MQYIIEMEGTCFTPALEGMKHVKPEEGELLTKPFLEVCKQILPVIGAFSSSRYLHTKMEPSGNCIQS